MDMDLSSETAKSIIYKKSIDDKLLERLAELEHIKWQEWARHLLSEEPIGTQRVQRWARLFVAYKDLPESEKEKDRVLARRVLESLREEMTTFYEGK